MRSLLTFIIVCCTLFYNTQASGQTINTFAGGVGSGLATNLGISPNGIAIDNFGNMYIADKEYNVVRKVNSSGIATVFAGNGGVSFSGDGGPATAAQLLNPTGVAVDSLGNVYIVDYNRIRKVNTSGIISTIAGNGMTGFSGDGGIATSAQLNTPNGVAVDGLGNVYIADASNNRVRKVDTSGLINTVAGNGLGGYSGDGGPATAARLTYPSEVAIDSSGNLYIADYINHVIRKVNSSGIITTIAGNGVQGYGGDGGAATAAQLNSPYGVAVDGAGNVYIADMNNGRIRMVNSSGIISTIAGNGTSGFSGDGGLATAAQVGAPLQVAVDGQGNVYLTANYQYRIRKVNTSGIISTVAGNGRKHFGGDGGPASAAQMAPDGIAIDVVGNMYIADWENNRVRMIDTVGVISTIAGNGNYGYSGDGGPATAAELRGPTGIAVDSSGNVYIVDNGNNCIRKINTSGVISTIAGDGTAGYTGNGGPATMAKLNSPYGIAVDNSGNVYIADQDNHEVRKINPAGIISAIAGNGTKGYGGDGGVATNAQLYYPTAVAVDGLGNVYIADQSNNRVRKINTAGIISTIAGNGIQGYSGDSGSATAAKLNHPFGIAVDGLGNVYLADVYNNRVRQVNTFGVINTIAGSEMPGYSGDGGATAFAKLNNPISVAVDGSGNVYVSDAYNFRIRKVTGIPVTSVVNIVASKNTLSLYPNPNDGSFIVKGSLANKEQHTVTVDVFNTIGHSVYKETFTVSNGAFEHQIELPKGLSTGNYFLKLSDGEHSIIRFTVAGK